MELMMRFFPFAIVWLPPYLFVSVVSVVWLLWNETLVVVDEQSCSVSLEVLLRDPKILELVESQVKKRCFFAPWMHNPFILGIPIWKTIWSFRWEHEGGVLKITTK